MNVLSVRAANDCYIILAKLFSDFEHDLFDRRQIDTFFFNMIFLLGP